MLALRLISSYEIHNNYLTSSKSMNYTCFDPYLKGLEKVVNVLLMEGIQIAAFSMQ
jgi:hypothetical protein